MTEHTNDPENPFTVKADGQKLVVSATYPFSAVLGVITQRPPGNGGAGTYRKVKLNPDGSVEPIGDDIPIIFPRLD